MIVKTERTQWSVQIPLTSADPKLRAVLMLPPVYGICTGVLTHIHANHVNNWATNWQTTYT